MMEQPLAPKAQILEPGTTFYRPFRGELKGMLERTLAILFTDFSFRIKNKWVIFLEVLAMMFGVFPVVLLFYFAAVVGGELTSDIFMMFYGLIFIWLVLICTVGGSKLISDDYANNSFTLYLSRPITKTTYFIGKYGSIFLLVSTISFIPSLLMAAIIVGFNAGVSDLSYDLTAVVLTLIALGFLIALVFSSIAMVLSSLTKNSRYAGVGIFCALLFPQTIGGILSDITEDKHANLISFSYLFNVIADKWSGFNTVEDFDWPLPFGIVMLIVLVCFGITWFKLSKSELSE